MRTAFIIASAAFVLGAVYLSASAAARSTHHCSFALTGRFTDVGIDTGHPPQNGSNTGAAIVDGTLCGKPFHGAARDVNRFPRLGKVDGTGVVFGPLGSLKVQFAATATLNADHSATLRGSSVILGGSGAYANARGSGIDRGAQAPNSPITIQHLTGTIDY
jgi:hypothetical protein